MEFWKVSHDRKAGSFSHTLPHGFGHALMAQTIAPVFKELRVSAAVWDGGEAWWPIHVEPNIADFEVEHGVIEGRHVHNERNLAALRERGEAVKSEHA
ncbi:MAG TPA: hypothetical protein VGP93_14365, partial [Polyangiaceae bacterium]|nr:hypothetical protein [Polyangiaceae bacterium]